MDHVVGHRPKLTRGFPLVFFPHDVVQCPQDVSRRTVRVLGELTGGDDALVHDVSHNKMAPGQGEELPQSHHVEDGTACGYKKVGGFLSEGKKVSRSNIVRVAYGETGIDNMNDDFQHIVAQTGKDTVRYPIVVWGAGFGARQEFSQKTHGDHRAGHR
jgi:hypothetical protein